MYILAWRHLLWLYQCMVYDLQFAHANSFLSCLILCFHLWEGLHKYFHLAKFNTLNLPK